MIRKNTTQPTLKILFFLLIFNFHFAPLQAQTEIPDSLAVKRIQFIKNTLEHDLTKTKRWWYGWLGAYSAATLGQGAVYLTSNDKSTRQDMALGAATTLLGAAGQFISPLTPVNWPGQINSMPENTRSERLEKLTKAETLFSECAMREKLVRSWKNHALTGAVNLGGGLITWLGFKRSVWAGAGYFALNTAVTETQIWTQPTLAKRNFRKYRQKYPEDFDGISYVPRVSWSLKTYPGGIGVKVVF